MTMLSASNINGNKWLSHNECGMSAPIVVPGFGHPFEDLSSVPSGHMSSYIHSHRAMGAKHKIPENIDSS